MSVPRLKENIFFFTEESIVLQSQGSEDADICAGSVR
jgi:hypothetical protein